MRIELIKGDLVLELDPAAGGRSVGSRLETWTFCAPPLRDVGPLLILCSMLLSQ